MSGRTTTLGKTRARPQPPPTPRSRARADYQRALLHRVPAILYMADAGEFGAWRYVSPQIDTILGYSPAEWCADPGLWASRLHPDDRQLVIEAEARTGHGDAPQGASEYRLLHRDGHVVWVRDDALLVVSEDGTTCWHGVMSDITERKQVEAELERRAAQQAAVARLGEHALEGASLSDLLLEAARAAGQLLDVEIAIVTELVPERDAFVFRAAYGLTGTPINQPLDGAQESQLVHAVRSGAPVVVTDWELETRFARLPILAEHGVRSGLSVVIEGRRGPFGVLGLHSTQPRDFKPEDIDFVQSLANVLGDAVERQLTDDDIRHRALHDQLTGLPNRLLFIDRLQQALERQRRRRSLTAILVLDLDRFKLVNDSLGHRIGDELLAAAAPRLKQAIRSSDTVARFGGDEFAILLEEIGDEREAIEMAQRIAGVFARPFVLGGNEHFVTTSIGIALARGGEQPEDLIRDAGVAMNRAKERGRARYELFDVGLRGRAISRLQVENDLRRALDRDELRLDYQPLVSLRDHSIVGVEALIRWDHPVRGLIAPSDFISVAEENGLIEPIGYWVLDHACRQAARWSHARSDAQPISISVNLSAVQVANRGLAQTIDDAVRATGLDPACLSLEITESVLLADVDGLSRVLEALKGIGARLVLDDFGVGYSSLSYLTRLPIDALKVDRSFVDGLGTEPGDTAITEAIIAMSHALSLDVVGEGAETALQIAELTRLGCDFAQGFHFSRPVPADAITQMLTAGPAWV